MASTVSFVNDPDKTVDQAIDGLVWSSPSLSRLEATRVVMRADWSKDAGKVALISGGGSGHEPAHAGFVGSGMLAAAVCGDVFASPPVAEVFAAIEACCGPAGCLLIVKNYTGDRLNFGIAAERAKRLGMQVEMCVVDDDCAIPKSKTGLAGRRGLAGTLFVHKVAGALAEAGKPLPDVVAAAAAVAGAVSTMSVSASPCVVPGRAPSFTLPAGKVELGLGIHGEAGFQQAPATAVDELVDGMVARILENDPDLCYLPTQPGDAVALLLNNLGGTSNLEMSVVARAALQACASRGINVVRFFSGALMTSLQMAGFSVTLLKLEPDMVAGLDAPVAVPAWPAAAPGADVPKAPATRGRVARQSASFPATLDASVIACMQTLADAMVASEAVLTDLDAKTGDGDMGKSVESAGLALRGLLAGVSAGAGAAGSLAQALEALGDTWATAMGGSSGVFYNLALSAASASLGDAGGAGTAAQWSAALSEAAASIMKYGGAKSGNRTMLDALVPASELLAAQVAGAGPALAKVVAAADQGAKATATMAAGAGRSSYIDAAAIAGHEDPGARAVAIYLGAVRQALGGN